MNMMRHLFFSLFFLLTVGIMPCQAGGKQLQKALKALGSLERSTKAQAKDHQNVVDQLNAVINSVPEDAGEAYLLLAEAYSEWVPAQFRDYSKAAEYYEKACGLIPDSQTKEKARALYNTANYRYFKYSPTQNLDMALEYFVMATELNPGLSRSVGEMFEFGLGCDIDPTTALTYYKKAIDNGQGGNTYAKYYSTLYYVNLLVGENGASLDTVAFDNFRKGILEQRMAKEQTDYNKAKEHLTAAAERGYLPAQFDLGSSYMSKIFQGSNAAETRKIAERWLREAADAGYVPAMHNLATLIYYTDVNQALEYYELAAELGFPPAKEYLEQRAKIVKAQRQSSLSLAGKLLNGSKIGRIIFSSIADNISTKHNNMTAAQKAKMRLGAFHSGESSAQAASIQSSQDGGNKITCWKCNGTGKIKCLVCKGSGQAHNGQCSRCHGETTIKCINCDGKGWK